ncbi:SspB family protein [Tepidicaulis sp.]|uniref:SspB family protein n=1 Tax=Tepidicaulis sp. TaxID=1920809 RepID=UPI003B5B6063
MADTPSQDLMRYDLMAQEALKGVVRKSLEIAGKEGLPGEHHFYISFRTDAPGVQISDRLKEQYPEEITIVLQHQFWDLDVSEKGFSVNLSFNKVPERLVVPFSALLGFFDPSVQFGLQFAQGEDAAADEELEPAQEPGTEDAESPAPGEAGGDVVSLDAFRKNK